MTERTAPVPTSATRAARAPRQVALLSPVLKRLLQAGVPLGPNALVTIRGRVSGEPRTVPLAILEVDGRRWVWSPWGDVNWVRNLRAARRATVRVRGTSEEVLATELDALERVAFFRDVLAPYARALRGGIAFVRVVDGVDLADPVRAAEGRCVFELRPVEPA